MLKIVKYFIILVALLTVVGFISGYLLFYRDADAMKQTLERAVSYALDRPTQIKGTMSWHLFPHLNIAAHDVIIYDKKTATLPTNQEKTSPQADPPIFLQAKRAEFILDWQKALKRQFMVHKISLNGARLNLKTRVDGSNNWQDLLEKWRNRSTETKKQIPRSKEYTKNTINIQHIEIKNGTVDWQNQLKKQTITLSNLVMESKKLNLEEAFPLQLRGEFSLTGKNKKRALTGSFELDARVDLNKTPQRPLQDTLTVNGMLRFHPLSLPKFFIQAFKSPLDYANNNLSLPSIEFTAYGGKATGQLIIRQVFSPTPNYTINLQMHSLNAEQFFQHALGKVILKGNTDFALKLTSQGREKKEIVRHSNGSLLFSIKNGHFGGANFVKLAQWATVLVHEDTSAAKPDTEQEKTYFQSLSGSGKLVNGILYNEDLSLTSPEIAAKGQGTINFNTSAVAYTAHITLLKIRENSKIGKLQSQLGGHFPLRIVGNFEHLKTLIDFKNILEERAKIFIEDNFKKLFKKKIEKDPRAQQLLKKIFT